MLCLYLATYINHENTNNKTQNIFANLSFIRRPPWPQIKAISKLLSLCSYHFGPTCHGWAWNSKTHHWQTRRNVSSPPRPPWVPRGSTLWPRLQSCHLLDCYNHEPLVPPPPPLLPLSCPHIKLEVPCFDGHNPLGWIFKISQFFEYQATPKEECITLASFYLNGPALSWFEWSYRKAFITTWPGFLQVLESRFAPMYCDDPKGALFKLTQWDSVNDYLTKFDRLANKIIGLPPLFLLSCFIFGLSLEISLYWAASTIPSIHIIPNVHDDH